MTTERPHGSRRPRRRAPRVLLVVGVLAVLAVAAAVVVPLVRPPGPRPDFQLPVACGETWRLSTYPGHDDYDVDLFPTSGQAWGRPVLASAAGTVTVAAPWPR
ncbi:MULTISPECIES: hypothetical protein [unclassified Micromonospora]|uniref:hypothetical protein n=1 Tax=unclassified Micromonospora TaxID=2617518 RepID=UPI002FF40CAE